MRSPTVGFMRGGLVFCPRCMPDARTRAVVPISLEEAERRELYCDGARNGSACREQIARRPVFFPRGAAR